MMNTKGLTASVIAISVAAVILGGGAAYWLTNSDDGEEYAENIETDMFTGRMSSLTFEEVARMGSTDPEKIRMGLSRSIPEWVSSHSYMIPGYDSTLISSDINVTRTMSPVNIPSPYTAHETPRGYLEINSGMFGTFGAMPLVPAVMTDVTLIMEVEPDTTDQGGSRRIEVKYSTETMDPEMTVDSILNHIQNDMNGWHSSLSRDVEYMLNSLVKLRAKGGVGNEFGDTNYHLLNEGDVELAVNFAIALRFAAWTGTVPVSLVSDIDSYFTDLTRQPLMNPTGKRAWGEAEKENYDKYIQRSRNEPRRRSAEDIISLASSFGHADSADLLLRLIYMDRAPGSMGNTEGLDLTTPLEESQLLDPRQPTDVTDPYSLAHHPGYPTNDRLMITTGTSRGEPVRKEWNVRIENDYIVQGNRLDIRGVDDFSAWYTNADLSLTDEKLINYGNSTVQPTRCGLIPPPEKPPERDHRVQWDIDISGSIPVDVSTEGWSGNTYSPDKISRELTFSFPVRIHTGTERIYPEGFKDLFNLNTGSAFTTNFSGGWVITPEANATEYFTGRVWPELKGAFNILTSLSRTTGIPDDPDGQLASRQRYHVASIAALSSLENWLKDSEISEKLAIFYMNKIKDPGLDIGDLGPIELDGHSMGFSYSPARDRMEITSELPEGDIMIRLWPVMSRDIGMESTVSTVGGTRIELDSVEGSFSLHGEFDGQQINEGSSIPESPAREVWEVIGRGGRILSSPLEMKMENIINPYSGDLEIPSTMDGKAMVSVEISGPGTEGVEIDRLPELREDHHPLDLLIETVRLLSGEDVTIGLRAEIVPEDENEITRTVHFITPHDLTSGSMDSVIHELFIDMMTLTHLRVPDGLSGLSIAMTETVKGWNLAMQGEVTTVFHLYADGDVRISYFKGVPMEAGERNSDWRSLTDTEPVPLW